MCGIAGILTLSPDDRVAPDLLHAMAAELQHRGPDDEGVFVDSTGRCGFGFRRLSIIDLQTGQQPISNADETIHVAFNGEIYNFRELRQELQQRGHRFRTQGDAESIVHAYAEWGEHCFEHLDGMFAIAIWDAPRRRLLLARDRFGKKPLNYAIVENRLFFASEVKAILALPGVPRELDAQSLHRYLLFQYVPAPHSIYRGFRKLLPGTYETFDLKPDAAGYEHAAKRYWQVPHPAAVTGNDAPRDEREAIEQLDETLTRAVKKRLVSDVPLGAFLSGGIDSSIVVGIMRKLGVSPLRTFSIGFGDARYDETRYARLIAERFETEHHEYQVTPQATEILDTLAHHYDEPFADSSAIPTYYVSRYTRQSVTVALTGDGGDEAFTGYDRYRAAQLAGGLDWLPQPLRRIIGSTAGILPHSQPKSLSNRAYRFLSCLGQSPARRYLSWIGVFEPGVLAQGYQRDFATQLDADEPLRWMEAFYMAASGPPANRAAYTDLLSYLPYDLLTKVDIASMACSLECRSPFLDHKLVEFSLSLPPALRLGPNGQGKHLLRRWAEGFLPPEVLTRPKMGFGVPVGQWFRAELRDLLRERVLATDGICARVFEPTWLQQLVEAHISGRSNHEHRLWALLMLELWAARWLR
ncbi:asparagine synthase (glutamine-hydrolyzing) [uncultured Ilyobacter sp.]|uniref:asparagine synthase (glutamine-hydrolyzing) n=1 Tax=uncultured Ilyobacter sp. TaxID=544433 RepID=UPI0029F463D8|nr:asparagine synthase (glutamine-hydrolyzing) [uncultured Ilyobacter sp.]